jgi:ADP-heptose:LPS heptosyltransferase
MALPVVHALTPHCEVTWLIRRGNAPLLKLFPQVDCRRVEVDFLPGGRFHAGVADALAAERFDALVDLSNWDNVAQLTSQLKSIPVRAIAYDDTRAMLRQRVRDGLPWGPFNRAIKFRGKLHRVEKWRRLLEHVLDVPLSIDWPLRVLPPSSSPLKVFIQPHSSKPDKRWPVEHFAAAVTQLARHRPIECQINQGTTREHPTSEALERELERAGIPVVRVPLDPTFTTLRNALVQSDVALGPDSGPLQLASILGTPSVVIFGPYAPTEVAPRWRSTAVTPARAGGRVQDVTPDAVGAALVAVVLSAIAQA